MIRDDRWTTAGTEPRLSDMLSDSTTRTLMAADGISADDVNAVIERIRRDVRPTRLVLPPVPAKATAKYVEPVRRVPLRGIDRRANMRVASGVVSRWIAALVADRRLSLN